MKSNIIEIKYYENKGLPEGSPYFNYYTYKSACIKECNRTGICDDCVNILEMYYKDMIM